MPLAAWRNACRCKKKPLISIFKLPEPYEKWEGPPDPRTGIAREHDPQPRVIPLGKNPGRYAFEWIALDGTKKRAIYERPDGTDAIVAAQVSEASDGYQYTYRVEVLPTSGVRLGAFMVQCFSDQVTPTEEKEKGIFVGKMWNGIPQFREGTWIDFAIRERFVPNGSPGETVTLSLSSASPPGLVECRTRSNSVMNADLDMPYEFHTLMDLGHDYWPHGYTIGPVERLKSLSQRAHLAYVAKLLPQLKELGWIHASAVGWYQRNLTPGTPGLYKQVEQDLNNGKITTEVFSLLFQATKRFPSEPSMTKEASACVAPAWAQGAQLGGESENYSASARLEDGVLHIAIVDKASGRKVSNRAQVGDVVFLPIQMQAVQYDWLPKSPQTALYH